MDKEILILVQALGREIKVSKGGKMAEEIIIDDIDVSQCGQSYYDCDSQGNPINRIKCHREYNDRIYYCDEFHNCNFKQLKRKEQECEGLKQELQKVKEQLWENYKWDNIINQAKKNINED